MCFWPYFVLFFSVPPSDSDSDVDRISEWKRRDEERRRELEEKRKREQEEELRRLREQEREEKERKKERAEKGDAEQSDSESSVDEVPKKSKKGRPPKAPSSSDSEVEKEVSVEGGENSILKMWNSTFCLDGMGRISGDGHCLLATSGSRSCEGRLPVFFCHKSSLQLSKPQGYY